MGNAVEILEEIKKQEAPLDKITKKYIKELHEYTHRNLKGNIRKCYK